MFKNTLHKCAQLQALQLYRYAQAVANRTIRTNNPQCESDINPIVDSIIENLAKGNRATLASAITLVETEHKGKKKVAEKVLQRIFRETSSTVPKTFRIGLSGPPGAGKSTFIEVFGKYLTGLGHRVAVLAVDPSSATSGGSILGDKTRMPELSKDKNAYIRPSPARGHLGGVTRSTNEAIVLCEYAGYDIILVETVGVGQSEYAVSNMVDLFVLLLPPGGGDELQGVKRGIVERANILLVTKADGDLKEAAFRTQYEYTSALKFIRSSMPNWKTKVVAVSSRTKDGLENFWSIVTKYRQTLGPEKLIYKRGLQRTKWMWSHVDDGLKDFLLCDPVVTDLIRSVEKHVELGLMSPGAASDKILKHFRKVLNSSSKSSSTAKSKDIQ